MNVERIPEQKSAERFAFEHYLRTGQRLTTAQWLAREERKFNPYHDEIGRFTSPPGVTISWGNNVPAHSRTAMRQRTAGAVSRATVGTRPTEAAATSGAARQTVPAGTSDSPSGFRSNYVRDAVADHTAHADSYFELNKRQRYLDELRRGAGPDPSPAVRADLDDFQRRLDADRVRLAGFQKIADKEINELLRTGSAPYDIAVGTAKVVTGQGELRDYLSMAGAIPLVGAVGKAGKFGAVGVGHAGSAQTIEQLGGAYRHVRKLKGYHAHHLIARSVSPLSKGDGPAICDEASTPQNDWKLGQGPRSRSFPPKTGRSCGKRRSSGRNQDGYRSH